MSQTKAPCGSFDARAAETRLAGGLASWALLLGHEHELGHVDYWRGDEPPPRNDDRDWGAAWAAVATAVRNRRAREASRPRFWPPPHRVRGQPRPRARRPGARRAGGIRSGQDPGDDGESEPAHDLVRRLSIGLPA